MEVSSEFIVGICGNPHGNIKENHIEKRRLVKNSKENKQKSSTNRNGSEVRPVNNKTKPTVR